MPFYGTVRGSDFALKSLQSVRGPVWTRITHVVALPHARHSAPGTRAAFFRCSSNKESGYDEQATPRSSSESQSERSRRAQGDRNKSGPRKEQTCACGRTGAERQYQAEHQASGISAGSVAVSTSRKITATIRQGGPGASHENAKAPLQIKKPPVRNLRMLCRIPQSRK